MAHKVALSSKAGRLSEISSKNKPLDEKKNNMQC